MEAIVVRGQFHWGFAIREPLQSALQSPLFLPPPGTLIGALARAVEKVESRRYGGLEDKIKWAAFGFDEKIPGLSLTSLAIVDINRHLKAPYSRKERRSLPEYKFAAVPTGKVYVPAFKVVLLYLGEGISRLGQAAWGISRLGSKESLFTVLEVQMCRVTERKDGELNTSLYVPKDKASPLVPDNVMELELWRQEGEKVKVYAPRMLEEVPYKAERVEICDQQYVKI
ncbi:type I-A CRISPR-associated protein Cas5a [Pyrobaculum sp. 3827-6]|uniref:type I-A CRISPR-associated protein Cas5a n=1 Tax=Pyrobaculum sp. 3827-6 TaxID=2983604 RepID=UPI0021DA24C2|nr:type I-A CRISPR-associated protein Cas5a [Pyrobaculum sp. 3827-6]MCU7786886.1 type I-A CRISPR-associated protein Cas5a [Pyrobaculum sp. 3827-6]